MKESRIKALAMSATLLGGFVIGSGMLEASPIEELYLKHLVFYADFESGTADSKVGELKAREKKYLVSDGEGLFGSKAWVSGGTSFHNAKNKAGKPTIDMTKPGTALFWFKLREDNVAQLEYDPGMTHFNFLWSGEKRLLLFRQDGRQTGYAATAPLSAFFETRKPDGKRYVARSNVGPSFRKLKAGEWHLMVMTWKLDEVAVSYDGSSFNRESVNEPMGPGMWLFNMCNYGDGLTPGYLAVDDCSVLDFAMSNEQVKELYDEYMEAMKEEGPSEGRPEVEIVNIGKKTDSKFEIALKLKNKSSKPVSLMFGVKAKPENSQPTIQREDVKLGPRAEKVVSITGPVLNDEKIVADIGVVEAGTKRCFFRRHRVFAPNAPEPEWMKAPSRLSFKFAYYPTEKTIHASADISACEDKASAKSIKLTIEKAGEKVIEKSFPADPSGKTEIFWRELPDFDGDYVCKAEMIGIKDAKAEQNFVRRHFEWEGNKLGLSDAIPAPFHKVKVQDEGEGLEKVSVVLRDHLVEKKTGLWRQVTAQGKDILARPMSFVGKDGVPSSSAGRGIFPGETAWDVDGVYELSLTLKKGHHEPISLEIPLKAERASLMHTCIDGLRHNYAGKIPEGLGRVWEGKMCKGRNSIVGDYVPYIWVGGPLRGIAVFGENDKGWVVGNEELRIKNEELARKNEELGKKREKIPCQEIIREKDGTIVIRLNLVQKAVDLKEDQVIRLGFQATPVKPMMENWRGEWHGSLLGACWYWGSYNVCCALEPYDGTDLFFKKMGEARHTGKRDEEFIKEWVKNYPYSQKPGTPERAEIEKKYLAHINAGMWNASGAGKHNRLVFYTNGRGVEYGDPKLQGATFLNEWNRFEYMSRDLKRSSAAAYDLDPTKSHRDYAAWWYNKMFVNDACDVMYWDDVFMTGCFNMVETDAYRLPSGQIQPASGLNNMRALIRRCAVLQTELGKTPRHNWVHMTNTAIAPICSFAGVNYDWEDLSGENPHQMKYSKDYILACTIGRQMGNRVGIMGYFKHGMKDKEKLAWLEHTAIGIMLTHELRWNAGHKENDAFQKKLCEWGYRTSEVEVWNYWDEDIPYPIAVKGGELTSILMKNKTTGEYVIGVCSFEDHEVMVNIDLGEIKAATAKDFVSDEAMALNGKTLSFRLPKYDWKAILLR